MGTDIFATATDNASAEAPLSHRAEYTTPREQRRAEVDTLADRIASLAASIDAAEHQQLTAIRRFDELGGWARQGAKTCAHWLSWRIGLGLVAAREKVRVAKALAELPRIDAALATGTISYTKVRALTRVATPDNEDLLLEQARSCTGAALETLCAKFRRAQQGDLLDPERRFVRKRTMDDGTIQLTIRLLPDEADTVMTALHHVRAALADASAESPIPAHRASAESSADPDHASPESSADAADASAESPPSLVDAAVALALGELHGHDRQAPAAERRLLTLHLAEDRIGAPAEAPAQPGSAQPWSAQPWSAQPWSAELHDGTPLCSDSLLRLACDTSLVVATTDAHDNPLHLGRRRRTVSTPLLRALRLRDRHCRFPGCQSRAFLDAHHVEHWLHGGETSLDNLVLLCGHHHTQIHEGGLSLTLNDGAPTFRDERGEPIPHAPTPPSGSPLRNEPPRTNLIRWNGRPQHPTGAVTALLRRAAAQEPASSSIASAWASVKRGRSPSKA